MTNNVISDVVEYDDCVNLYIVYDYANPDPEGDPTITEYTPEEYAELNDK